jgi:uncharacterized membrane protein HdeD (DUF308 family)
MSMTSDVAVQVMREELRASVERHSGWYFWQATLMVVAGIFALVHPLHNHRRIEWHER